MASAVHVHDCGPALNSRQLSPTFNFRPCPALPCPALPCPALPCPPCPAHGDCRSITGSRPGWLKLGWTRPATPARPAPPLGWTRATRRPCPRDEVARQADEVATQPTNQYNQPSPCRNLEFLENELEAYYQAEQEKMEAQDRRLKKMQKRLAWVQGLGQKGAGVYVYVWGRRDAQSRTHWGTWVALEGTRRKEGGQGRATRGAV
jgi:hypothetical protein